MSSSTNILAKGIEIVGSIKFSNDMLIDGKVEGEVSSEKGSVTIGENAIIKGDVKAGEVNLYGQVEGRIETKRCVLNETSKLIGDIKTKTLSTKEGAKVEGKVEMG